ncbi:PTS sugar transporter subunit IIB [Anaerosinus massiliensis]|uniref:PTS sugar transporter subunit IIB n=1 Tax=Massilibacillus massiliensis TaxID=1806837 RepID=UPI000B30EF90|nr:PTS sugar transporter subunit IIB [Massilibacillus massiliensis]
MNILLVCAAGLSTSLLVNKMKAALTEEQKDWRIEAHPIAETEDFIKDFDVVLLGPQVGHKLNNLKKDFGSYGKPIAVINPMDYGMGRGKEVIAYAEKLYKEQA